MTKSIICIACTLLALSSAFAQSAQPDAQQQPSPAYSDTVRKLKDWVEHCCSDADDQRFGWLFAESDFNKGELLKACGYQEEDVSEKAFKLLQVIGGEEFSDCLQKVRQRSRSYLVGAAGALNDDDFIRFKKALAPRLCETTKNCQDEQLPEVSDSSVYALILDGTDKAQALLRRVYALRASGMEALGAAPDTLNEAMSLVPVARQASDQLGSLPDVNSVLATAFYIAPEHRKNAVVKFLAHSRDSNRMLLRVSYVCGMLCGQGYVIVLERRGEQWSYAFIALEWIS
jgi:hypothetical protein